MTLTHSVAGLLANHQNARLVTTYSVTLDVFLIMSAWQESFIIAAYKGTSGLMYIFLQTDCQQKQYSNKIVAQVQIWWTGALLKQIRIIGSCSGCKHKAQTCKHGPKLQQTTWQQFRLGLTRCAIRCLIWLCHMGANYKTACQPIRYSLYLRHDSVWVYRRGSLSIWLLRYLGGYTWGYEVPRHSWHLVLGCFLWYVLQ